MTWKHLGLVSLALAIFLWMPITRRGILAILPLGHGLDDLLFVIAAALAVILWGGRIVAGLQADTNRLLAGYDEHTRRMVLFGMIVSIALVVIVLLIVAFWILAS